MPFAASPRWRRAGELALVAAPALVVLVLLVPFVDRDPVGGITFSNAPFTDEGFVTLNARNWALFGRFALDEWAPYLLTLPFTVIDALVLRVAGVGIVQARLVDVTCVALTALVLGAGLRRPFGTLPAFVAATAFATSSLVLYYGGTALIEPVAGLFLASGTLTLLGIDGSRPGRSGLLGGVLLALALGCKAITAPAVAGVLVVALVAAIRLEPARRWLVGALAVIALAALAWAVLFGLPNAAALIDLRDKVYPQPPPLNRRRLLARLGDAATFGRDSFALFAAPLLISAVGGIVVTIVRRSAAAPSTIVLVAAAATATIAADLVIAVSGYMPNRYLVPELPLLAILAAPAVRAVLDAAARLGDGTAERGRLFAGGAALVLVVLLGAQGLLLHASWVTRPGHQLTAAQAAVASAIPESALVGGQYAPLVAMSSDGRIVLSYGARGGVNPGDLYERGMRWWLDDRPPAWAGLHSDAWSRAERVTCLDPWTIKSVPVCLWRLP